MATSSIQVNVIDVGQGQCTFIEIYDTSITLVQTLLFDCGTNSSHKDDGIVDENLNYIARKVAGMAAPSFGGIFFSHGDTDHTNLTKSLLDKINALLDGTGKSLAVTKVWYGGARADYYKNGYNIITILEDDYHAAIFGERANDTSYNKDSGAFNTGRKLWSSTDDEVVVYAILTNALSNDPDWEDPEDVEVSRGTDAESKNRVSLVCGLYYKNAAYIICGDATNTTMSAINSLFTGGTSVFNNNHMMTLPHHGSRATGLAVKSGDEAQAKDISTVKTFAKTMKAQTITVSAYQKHSHPSIELMDYFPPYNASPVLMDLRLNAEDSHLLSAYIDNGLTNADNVAYPKTYTTFETRSNMFSTRYYGGNIAFSYQIGKSKKAAASKGITSTAGAINPFACWQYDVTSKGFVLRGFASMAEGVMAFTFPTSLTSNADRMIDISKPNVLTVRSKIRKNKVLVSRPGLAKKIKQFH